MADRFVEKYQDQNVTFMIQNIARLAVQSPEPIPRFTVINAALSFTVLVGIEA